MSKVEVKNISTATVVLVSSDLRMRRELQPGRVATLEENFYEDLTFSPGFQNLIDNHYIQIIGDQNIKDNHTQDIFDADKIKKMLENQDITAFAKFIPNAANAEKQSAVKFAIDMGITNGAFTALIKKYCGIDIVKAIAMKHELEEK